MLAWVGMGGLDLPDQVASLAALLTLGLIHSLTILLINCVHRAASPAGADGLHPAGRTNG
jgi:hypothetical protein